MAKYVYPAIFMPEENAYSIFFPDFTSCYTSAPTLAEGMAMANDVLCLTLYDMEENGQNVLGWFIGYLEKDGNTYYFAVNIQNEQDADGTAATALAFEVLEALGLWN